MAKQIRIRKGGPRPPRLQRATLFPYPTKAQVDADEIYLKVFFRVRCGEFRRG